jgi:hypothetical protein
VTRVPAALGAAAPEPPGCVAMRSELRVTAAGGVAARGTQRAGDECSGGRQPREQPGRSKEVRGLDMRMPLVTQRPSLPAPEAAGGVSNYYLTHLEGFVKPLRVELSDEWPMTSSPNPKPQDG